MNTTSISSGPRPEFAAAQNVREYNSVFTDTARNFAFRDFYRLYRNLNIYSYLGGLTIPSLSNNLKILFLLNSHFLSTACNEAVIWMVSKNVLPIYPDELNLLKMVKSDENLAIDFNNRPVQNLYNRPVTRYF